MFKPVVHSNMNLLSFDCLADKAKSANTNIINVFVNFCKRDSVEAIIFGKGGVAE